MSRTAEPRKRMLGGETRDTYVIQFPLPNSSEGLRSQSSRKVLEQLYHKLRRNPHARF
jgi:hypothetical protein